MKIAVSASGGSINALIEGRFGRAPYYVIFDSETMRSGMISNPYSTARYGAGPQMANILTERGVKVVLTGTIGIKARQELESAGISIVEGANGVVKEAVTGYLNQSRRHC